MTAATALNRSAAVVTAAFDRLLRQPKARLPAGARAVTAWRIAATCAAFVLALLVCMVFIDAPAATAARQLPRWVREAFDWISEFGESGWFLWPTGLLFLALSYVPRRRLTPMAQGVLAAAMVRAGFLFVAIGLPGLFITILKRLIGRARPFVTGIADPFVFDPFKWSAAYASLPSGHATTAFSVLVAFGMVWPRTRALLWVYALLIAASRIVVNAHYPSDILAGAAAGTLGVLFVRRYFALRHLGFSIAPDGLPHRYPGPSPRRIKAVARAFWAK
jgi:undecaprenyl-diphosphatase